METRAETVTRILQQAEGGDSAAADQLFGLVYEELHLLAKRQRARWRGDYTLNTTALVHEAYLKLVGPQRLGVESHAHFFALAARAMRHILSNYAKRRRTLKRGGDQVRLSLMERDLAVLDSQALMSAERAEVLHALEEAMTRLEAVSERQCRVVECRFYGGMSVPETATALGISPATVKRDWTLAQAWLYRELQR
jgi:RNA polymerase sigma factor (TIGR02999 family)